ncbi:MAG: RNA polymerase sigma factor RpoD/SigA [Bacteroidaceae bacterium]|jgi:RNA polymerase primary sigma factor|nr:RNA polymerase sigma factor RpoD/SigA [Bacteroidaceae bacterium]
MKKSTSFPTITDRSSDSMNYYLKEIRRSKPLTPEEEAELARTIREGGREADKARERLINANLRFVVSVANKYHSTILEISDLVSEGNYGLIKAVDHFDESKGVKFTSYAVFWIRQAILEALYDFNTIFRLPQEKQKILKQYLEMDEDIQLKEGRHITIYEFCEVSGYDYDVVAHVLESNTVVKCFEDQLGNDDHATLGDIIPSNSITDSNLDKESLYEDIIDVMNHLLTTREAFVVMNVMGIGCKPMAYEELAEKINLSRERTRQIFHKAIDKLRKSPYSLGLRNHLAA